MPLEILTEDLVQDTLRDSDAVFLFGVERQSSACSRRARALPRSDPRSRRAK